MQNKDNCQMQNQEMQVDQNMFVKNVKHYFYNLFRSFFVALLLVLVSPLFPVTAIFGVVVRRNCKPQKP